MYPWPALRIVRPERCHSFSELGQIWIGVMGGFLADIESHRFKGYSVPYLLRWMYEAVAEISKIGRDESTWHEEPQQEMCDRAAKAFTNFKLHADEV